jgi:hypothetical protein
MANFNLSDAAKNILLGEDSKSIQTSTTSGKRPEGGKLPTSVVAGQQDVGKIGDAPETCDDVNPNYTAGTPTSTPPGATPPVGSEPMKKLAPQPGNQGSGDKPAQSAATDYAAIRDRIAGKRAAQMMTANPGATFQSYGEETEYDEEEEVESLDEKEGTGASDPLANRQDYAKRHGTGQVYKKTHAGDKTGMSQAYAYDIKRSGPKGKLPEEVVYEEEHDDEKEDKKLIKKMISKEKMKEDMDALLSGENLSEEFVIKATTIFEAAVIARAEEVISEAEEQLMEEFEVAVEAIKEDLASKVDGYLNYMVEEWMKDNEIAIQSGLKAEITEEFLTGLRDLFIEHNIDIPEDKVDIVEELAAQLEATEAVLNEEIARGVELSQALNEQKKIEAIYTACEGLTQTQVEKMKSLAEGVDFTTEEEFTTKLDTLKESYFKADVKVATTDALDDEVLLEEEKRAIKSSNSEIDYYAKSISQTLVK